MQIWKAGVQYDWLTMLALNPLNAGLPQGEEADNTTIVLHERGKTL